MALTLDMLLQERIVCSSSSASASTRGLGRGGIAVILRLGVFLFWIIMAHPERWMSYNMSWHDGVQKNIDSLALELPVLVEETVRSDTE